MQKSLAPILAIAAALLAYLISANVIASFVAAFVVLRLLSQVSTFQVDKNSQTSENELDATSTRPAKQKANVAPVPPAQLAGERNLPASDSPPMLTDMLQTLRRRVANDPRADDDTPDRHQDLDDDRNHPVETIRRRVTEKITGGNVIDDMHATPEYMRKLADLDRRVSLGEVSDSEYDKIYDKIIFQAQMPS